MQLNEWTKQTRRSKSKHFVVLASFAFHSRLPSDQLSIDDEKSLGVQFLKASFDAFSRCADEMALPPVLDEPVRTERFHAVLGADAGHGTGRERRSR